MPAPQYRHTCFTYYKVDDPLEFVEEKMNYLVYQKEKCPSTGRLHYQGYVQFHNRVTFDYITKVLWPGVHLPNTATKGSAIQNRTYCTKEDSRIDGPWEHGDMRRQGARTDLDDAVEILEKHGVKRIAEELPATYVKYHRGFDALAQKLRPDPVTFDGPLDNYWIWGPPGVGKSNLLARPRFGPEGTTLFVKEPTKWWDKYADQPNVLIEDVDPVTTKDQARWWKLLCDRNPILVETKGGHITVRPRRIIVTSNYPLSACFVGVDYDAIKRRFNIIHITSSTDIQLHMVPRVPSDEIIL